MLLTTRYRTQSSRTSLAPSPAPTGRASRARPVPRRVFSSAPTDTASSSQAKSTDKTTHFGFKDVLVGEKEHLVGQVFSSVASKYDLMNDVMSAGVHRLWKDTFVSMLNPQPGNKIIDVAGGTGDIAFRMVSHIIASKKVSALDIGITKPAAAKKTEVTVFDINPQMLAEGRTKQAQLGLENTEESPVNLEFVEGNAESLPFPDAQFDAYTIAFGIRNCTNVDKVIQEAFRVLRPGGRFMCLEFSRVKNPLLSQIYDAYSFNLIPVFGKLVTNDSESYQYLVESIRRFPDQDTFKRMITDAGFRHVTYSNQTFGVCAIHSGFKPVTK